MMISGGRFQEMMMMISGRGCIDNSKTILGSNLAHEAPSFRQTGNGGMKPTLNGITRVETTGKRNAERARVYDLRTERRSAERTTEGGTDGTDEGRRERARSKKRG
eukprot:3218943-Pleurochrysis_carterae.AAC.1